MKRKLISILIMICLILAMAPVAAFAQTEAKTEFVAVSRDVVKTVDQKGVITIKKMAPKPNSEETVAIENGWPIIFAEKIGDGDTATYTVITDYSKITCDDSSISLYTNLRHEENGNMGTYGEPSEEYETTMANIFAKKVGTYTFSYKGQRIKTEIKLPDYGFYTKPVASIQNQMLDGMRFDRTKENVAYMIATNPEQLRSIKFTLHDEEMSEFATLEQMGEYGEICKVTVHKPTEYIWVHCGRNFANGDFDNSGNAFRIVERPEKAVIQKLSAAKRTITASWKTQDADGYQIKIAKNKAFSKGAKTYNVNGATKKTIKNLIKGQKYYVKVRAYSYAGGTYYGKWSSTKNIVCR